MKEIEEEEKIAHRAINHGPYQPFCNSGADISHQHKNTIMLIIFLGEWDECQPLQTQKITIDS